MSSNREPDWQWASFNELSNESLYQLLRLRNEVFICEQHCAYQDLDDNDQQAMHLLGFENSKLVAYARVLTNSSPLHFGRVLTAKTHRGTGYGHQLLQQLMSYLKSHFPSTPIHISAQSYLIAFYQHYGFKTQGRPYDEDGIPHILMVHND